MRPVRGAVVNTNPTLVIGLALDCAGRSAGECADCWTAGGHAESILACLVPLLSAWHGKGDRSP